MSERGRIAVNRTTDLHHFLPSVAIPSAQESTSQTRLFKSIQYCVPFSDHRFQ